MPRLQKGEGFAGQRIVVLPRPVVTQALGQPALRELMPTDVGFFPRAAGHWRERPQGAGQAIFIYCTQGAGWCEVAGQRRLINAGELLVIPPQVPHAYGAEEGAPWSIFWAHATGNSMKTLLTEMGVTTERPTLALGSDARLVAMFEEMIETLENGYTPAHLRYASRTLAHLLGTVIWHNQPEQSGRSALSAGLGETIVHMKRHLHQPLKIAQLAALANLSASHYSARFKAHTGYAPIDYFIRLRMQSACKLLDNSNLNVKEVAAALGYEDPFYFSRLFKALNDVSPSDYRRLRKG